jgi:hypothetical protein
MLEDFNDTAPYKEKIRQMNKELDSILNIVTPVTED